MVLYLIYNFEFGIILNFNYRVVVINIKRVSRNKNTSPLLDKHDFEYKLL